MGFFRDLFLGEKKKTKKYAGITIRCDSATIIIAYTAKMALHILIIMPTGYLL
jgi:hypothetical protein